MAHIGPSGCCQRPLKLSVNSLRIKIPRSTSTPSTCIRNSCSNIHVQHICAYPCSILHPVVHASMHDKQPLRHSRERMRVGVQLYRYGSNKRRCRAQPPGAAVEHSPVRPYVYLKIHVSQETRISRSVYLKKRISQDTRASHIKKRASQETCISRYAHL